MDKAENLNKAALGLNGVGLLTGFLSVGTGIRQAAKNRIKVLEIAAPDSSIPLEVTGPRGIYN